MDFWHCGLLKGPKSFTVKFCSLGGPLISDREECPPLVLVNFLISVLNINKLFSKSLGGGREVCSLTEAESCLPVFRLIIDFLPI